MVLGSTQTLTEMITSNISLGGGGKGGIHVPTVSKAVRLNLLETSRPVIGLYRDCVPFYLPDDLNPPLLNSQENLCFIEPETYR